jgi:transmembrane sensor
MKTPPLDSAAEEAASHWAARLEGSTLSAADRTGLDAWLAKNPGHRALLSAYCQFSADLEQTLPALASAGLIAVPAKESPRRHGWGLGWFAGGALATLAAALVVWLAWPAAAQEHLSTSAGQRVAHVLPDGTRVELNARTSLQLAFTGAERRVRMAEGEAFFTVSKNKARPFIIETPAGSVRVTGTVFDVRTEAASQLEVTVAEGSVQVRPDSNGGAPLSLGAGDRLTASASAGVEVKPIDASALADTLAWREGKIVLNGVPLREALARFARYHGRGIILSTTVDARDPHTIGSSYSLDDLAGFLNSIETRWPDLKVTPELNGTYRVTLRTQP